MFPCLGFLVADPSCSYRAPLFSLASALLQRSCEQLQPYVGNDSTPCRLALFLTLARLPDVRAFSSRSRDISHFTVTLNHPPVARYLALHRRRSEWSTKAQFPISIAAYHLGTQPSLALRTHLCSDDRTYDLDFPPAAISGSQLGALHDPGVPGSNSSSMHPSPPCAHAHYWWKDGVPHEDSILFCRHGHEDSILFCRRGVQLAMKAF